MNVQEKEDSEMVECTFVPNRKTASSPEPYEFPTVQKTHVVTVKKAGSPLVKRIVSDTDELEESMERRCIDMKYLHAKEDSEEKKVSSITFSTQKNVDVVRES